MIAEPQSCEQVEHRQLFQFQNGFEMLQSETVAGSLVWAAMSHSQTQDITQSPRDFHNGLGFSTVSSAVVWLPPPGLEDITPRVPLNWGSFGHPELCSRPCVYMCKGGGCSLGKACGYCHLPHEVARVNLDKKQRKFLSQMGSQERLVTFLPLFQRRAEETGLLPQAQTVIDFMAAELTDPDVEVASSRMLRLVEKTAKRMPLIQLAACCMKEPPGSVKAALVQLKAQLPPDQVVAVCWGQPVLL